MFLIVCLTMELTTMKKLLLVTTLGLSVIASVAAYAGAFTQYPQVGNTQNTQTPPGPAYSTTCTSFGNGGICNQYQPYGPTYLQGTETFPADTNYVNPQGAQVQPITVTIPTSLFGGGYGGATASATTGTTALVQVADGIGTYIYTGAGAATYTSFKLPANPMTNQKFCLANSSSGILTLTAITAGTNSFGNTPTITGVTPTSVPVMTAAGTAGTVTLGSNCWLYQAGANNTGIWYRVL